MIKEHITCKGIASLTLEDRINIINMIVNSYFQDDDGEIKYTPYFSEIGKIIAIAKYLISGISFDNGESIYDAVTNDEELNDWIKRILLTQEFQKIMDTVNDIVEYKKSENIARIQNETFSAIAFKVLKLVDDESMKTEKEIDTLDNLNQWINEQRKLNSLITPEMQRDFAENFDPTALTDAIIKKYSKSDVYEKNKEIVRINTELREKERKIIELENKLKEGTTKQC